MTTIRLEKSGYSNVTLTPSKVQEVLSKDVGNWPRDFYAPAQLPLGGGGGKPPLTGTSTIRQSMDFLNITREFTITATMDGNATSAGNVLSARDTLVNMFRSGGTLIFKYGDPSDITGSNYSASDLNKYFSTGFSVHIRRLMIDEMPKGGSGSEHSNPDYLSSSSAIKNAPEQFLVTITLLWAEDLVQS